MSNTLILLAVLGALNFLIRKFAAKAKDGSMTANEEFSAKRDSSTAQAANQKQADEPTWWDKTVKALQEANQGVVPEARLEKLLKLPVPAQAANAPVSSASSNPKPVKAKRASQAPIGVTYAQKSVHLVNPSRAATEPESKPVSAIDALIASRMSQKIGSGLPLGRKIKSKSQWTAQSMRQGVVMAEILSPPVALRNHN